MDTPNIPAPRKEGLTEAAAEEDDSVFGNKAIVDDAYNEPPQVLMVRRGM